MPLALGEKLVDAANEGDIALLKRLLKSKTLDVDYVNAGNFTALRVACGTGHAGAARLLLKAKAAVDLQNGDGCAALFMACQEGHPECAQLLLEEQQQNHTGTHVFLFKSEYAQEAKERYGIEPPAPPQQQATVLSS